MKSNFTEHMEVTSTINDNFVNIILLALFYLWSINILYYTNVPYLYVFLLL